MTSTSPDAAKVWRAAKKPLIILAILLAGVLVLIIVRGDQGAREELHPDSYAPDGGRALAQVLRQQGVRVDQVDAFTEAEAAQNATVLITRPDLLPPERLLRLRDQAKHLVLVGAQGPGVAAVLPGTEVAGVSEVENRQPECPLSAAVAAAEATSGGVRYQPGDGVLSCYPDDGAGTLVQRFGGPDTTVTLLGTPAPLTNERLDEAGNAALGLRLLGTGDRLVWYVPSPTDAALRGDEKSVAELVPDGLKFGLVQLFIAAVVLALWRARRLGRVVHEKLPVVVRAAETVEGRARLYRRSGATAHVAGTLRQATRARLAPRLGLAPDAEPPALIGALAARTGRPGAHLHALLHGPPPDSDPALVRLADELDRLEKEVDDR
ncbi:DUF4350 domain-containing protein [Amycolatopsis sp. 195334CR]|uniref:DUF4350 domain-containing protein n=1 Tax=Amycolatopsis sp. 195334CR TaxID=2814588 RepID=UPI001A903BE2|nr:DUF4350 domain-containing protein [Amycolatopsis sp. 195334CR]MBN6036770.1 DUF4350 domain-containing protein [Amycolatopsis sp. 195334CR]